METKQKKSPVFTLTLVENGVAGAGERADEVVIGVGPAFDKFQHQTLIDMPHKAIIKELVAGVEEEGLHARVVRILRTSDVSFMSWDAANLSGSGIGIGIQSKVVNDQMVRPKFMAKAALFHIKETKHVVPDAKPVALNIEIIREEK